MNIYPDIVKELMVAADMLMLNDAMDCCMEYFKTLMIPSNSFKILG